MTMAKYVIKEDLPEVTVEDDLLKVKDTYYTIQGVWADAGIWREKAMAHLAVAEYLDNGEPKLPTEPGSVIMLYKAKDWSISPNGMPVLLDKTKNWQSLSLDSGWIPPYDIEDWKPVQLTVVEVSP